MGKKTEKEEQKIVIEYNASKLPIWKTKEGTIVEGLNKDDFKAEGAKKEDWEPEFFRYMSQFKLRKAARFDELADACRNSSKEYQEKADNYGKELPPDEVEKRKLIKMLKSMKKQEAKLKEMGIDPSSIQ